MKLIAHRGNINGRNIELENTPTYIFAAINKGFDVEIDVWYEHGWLLLGHDKPSVDFCVDLDFLKNDHLWCHAKNGAALNFMLKNNVRCFWNDKDEYAIVSDGHIWTFSKNPFLGSKNILCIAEQKTYEEYFNKISGICSDYVELIQKSFEEK